MGIGRLHAENWLAEQGGLLSESESAEVVADRIAVWRGRLDAMSSDTAGRPRLVAATFVAVGASDGVVRGFAHAVADHDPRWGSLLGELHVHPSKRRAGIGRQLFVATARWLASNATSDDLYLFVRSENVAARALYDSLGGRPGDSASPDLGLRYYWTGQPRTLPNTSEPGASGSSPAQNSRQSSVNSDSLR